MCSSVYLYGCIYLCNRWSKNYRIEVPVGGVYTHVTRTSREENLFHSPLGLRLHYSISSSSTSNTSCFREGKAMVCIQPRREMMGTIRTPGRDLHNLAGTRI